MKFAFWIQMCARNMFGGIFIQMNILIFKLLFIITLITFGPNLHRFSNNNKL